MPNRAIEIHDSVLAELSFVKADVELHFSSVYIHESNGVPLRDAGSGWVQKAVLHILNARVKGVFSEFPVHLSDGQVVMGQNILDNEIPLPLNHKGAFELQLVAWRREKEVLTITGSGAELRLLGEPRYVEEFLP